MQSLHEGVLGSTSTHKDTTHHKACEDRIISAVIIYQRPPLFVKLVIMDMGGEGGEIISTSSTAGLLLSVQGPGTEQMIRTFTHSES